MVKVIFLGLIAFLTLTFLGVSPEQMISTDNFPAHIMLFIGATVVVIFGIMHDA